MAQPDPHFTEYVRTGSDAAFREIVTRHLPMAHSAARRLLGGREDAAADVAQAVFCQLARRAAGLPPDLVVSVWLYTQTVRAALNVIRSETRRAARERAAAELLHMNAPADPSDVNAALTPHIDRAVAALPELDRRALALRFFEKLELREIGDRLGMSAGAAQKRLTRALEKLRGRLARRGVALSVTGLTVWLSQESVRAAPAALTASTVAAAALQPAAAGGGGMFSFLTLMSGTKAILLGTFLGLAAGGTWATRPDSRATVSGGAALSSGTAAAEKPGPADTGGAAGQRFAVPAPATTAEALVAQFMDLISGPDNELTRLRVEAWLETVPLNMWTGLVELADRRLSEGQHQRWLQVLARRWALADPAVAIPALAQGKRGAVLAAMGFRAWYEIDPDKALGWLVEQQDNPKLQKALPGLITEAARYMPPDDAVRWASRLQGDDLRAAALQPAWQSIQLRNDAGAWNEACSKLLREEDPEFRRFALKQALAAWSKGGDTRSRGAGLPAAEQWLATLPHSPDKTTAAEFLLGEEIRFSGGSPPAAVTEALHTTDSAAAASRAVLATGEISLNARGWLLPLLTGPEREAAILHAARIATPGADGDWASRQPSQGEAIQWAAELSDPAVRDPLVYGLFQEWLRWQRGRFQSETDYAAEWTARTPLPGEIKALLKTARQEFEQKGKP